MNVQDVLNLNHAVNNILGKPEIKTALDGKVIYLAAKLSNKLQSINKSTGKHQDELKRSANAAMTKEGITDEDKRAITEQFNSDWQASLEKEVENPVEVKIPFEVSEKILQHIDNAPATRSLIEFLIAEPLPEMAVVK